MRAQFCCCIVVLSWYASYVDLLIEFLCGFVSLVRMIVGYTVHASEFASARSNPHIIYGNSSYTNSLSACGCWAYTFCVPLYQLACICAFCACSKRCWCCRKQLRREAACAHACTASSYAAASLCWMIAMLCAPARFGQIASVHLYEVSTRCVWLMNVPTLTRADMHASNATNSGWGRRCVRTGMNRDAGWKEINLQKRGLL
jgi:hypothetical protein